MASIRRLTGPRGPRYEYSLQVDGKQERKVYPTREAAEAALEERQRDRREGRAAITPTPFAEAVAQYLAYKASKGKRSVVKDRERLERHMLPFFGAATLTTEIRAGAIARYELQRATTPNLRLRRKTHRSPTASTVNRDLALLRHVLNLCRDWGYVREVPRIRLAKEPKGRVRYLERAEITRLLDACQGSQNPYLAAIVTVALYTGMRLGEILGLTWERIDFAPGVLVLPTTKNGEFRDVPMAEAVDATLAALRQPRPASTGLVFCKPKTGAAWGRLSTAFSVACRRAGLTGFRFHDLRHTAASWLVMSGRSLLEVKELLGHHSLAMTLRYAHLAPDRLREAVASLDAAFAPAVTPAASTVIQRQSDPATGGRPVTSRILDATAV